MNFKTQKKSRFKIIYRGNSVTSIDTGTKIIWGLWHIAMYVEPKNTEPNHNTMENQVYAIFDGGDHEAKFYLPNPPFTQEDTGS